MARAIRNAIRANRFARIIRNCHPYFYSASGRFARITLISDSRESPDSRESIRANHATKLKKCLKTLVSFWRFWVLLGHLGIEPPVTSVRETLCESGRCIDALKKRRNVLKKRGNVLKKKGRVLKKRGRVLFKGGGLLKKGGRVLRNPVPVWRSWRSSTPSRPSLCLPDFESL